ncbi:uncharacterized protein RCC_08741 [Ramularia collo-cygni]|uniref:Uncharacterized protein n=1 Tax=Ramularia collo-cygni TaxID=112498 RepID=A0A2D3VFX2_9PEZI|nr:uncharacterized protein RCC_08741 [Ramularia collo-cygni]CZT23031.1 uncharacterized protein RCC_08741 [Ramularia collo-cygni]
MGRITRARPDGKAPPPEDTAQSPPATSAASKKKGKLVAPTPGFRSMTGEGSNRARGDRLMDDVVQRPTVGNKQTISFENPAALPASTKEYRVVHSFYKDIGVAAGDESNENEEDEEDGGEDGDDTAEDSDEDNQAIRLNPDIFSVLKSSSYPAYITDGPVKKVRVTCIQTITFDTAAGRQERQILRRETIVSLGDGITVRDVSHLLGNFESEDAVVNVETVMGSNTYVEIKGTLVLDDLEEFEE